MERSNSEHADQIRRQPEEALSHDAEVLRVALIREHDERRRADCLAKMQTDVVQLALDLLVRDFDIESFFGGLTKNMVEESDSHVCAVWLIDDEQWLHRRSRISHDLFDDSPGRGARDQRVAMSMNVREELLAQNVDGRDALQIEQHSLVWLIEQGLRPVSHQLTGLRSCESTVESKSDDRCFSITLP